MPVVQMKTERRCKICAHDLRPDMDELLAKRSRREKDANGVLINGAYCLAKFAEWGLVNPTADNITTHWKKHSKWIADTSTAGEAIDQAQVNAIQEMLDILNDDSLPDNMDGDLHRLRRLGMAEIRRKIARGETSGITPEQLRWINAELTKRAHNDAQQDLLGALVHGAAKAIGAGLGAAATISPAHHPELPPGVPEVIDAEDADFTEEGVEE